MHPEAHVVALLDKAKNVAGTNTAVAKSLGISLQQLTNWRTGNATCSPENQALIAAVAGLDPAEFLVRAVVLKHQGTAKGDRLMKVLGKSSLAIGAVIGSAGAAAQQISSTVLTATGVDLVDLVHRAMQCALC
jgi:hypothetical protein